jgi:hypothetical protein
MFDKLKSFFQGKPLAQEEKEVFEKIAQYMIKNCRYVYSMQYIPRIVQRVGKIFGLDAVVTYGYILLEHEGIKYKSPHCFNVYNDKIIDLSTFVIREDIEKMRAKLPKEILPLYVIGELPSQLSYITEEPITDKDYQTDKLFPNDSLILAVYNDCKASAIYDEMKEMNLVTEEELQPEIYYHGVCEFEKVPEKK